MADIAREASVGVATVDRVLNQRGGVRQATRMSVLAAVARLQGRTDAPMTGVTHRRFGLLLDSGESFNHSMENAAKRLARQLRGITIASHSVTTGAFDAARFAETIRRFGKENDGLMIVARQDPEINRSLRELAENGKPVICLTTDLPGSGRHACIGVDQTKAGAMAGFFIGRFLKKEKGHMLLFVSAPYRCQEERETGFRRVIRSDYPWLSVEESLSTNDHPDYSYARMKAHLENNPPPLAIYNVGGGNLGIARALEEAGCARQVVFVAHELNDNSRRCLERGSIDVVLHHDIEEELRTAIAMLNRRDCSERGSIILPTLVATPHTI